MKELLRKLRFPGSRRRFGGELDEEMRFHLEERADELAAARGLPRAEALAQARREFGAAGHGPPHSHEAMSGEHLKARGRLVSLGRSRRHQFVLFHNPRWRSS